MKYSMNFVGWYLGFVFIFVMVVGFSMSIFLAYYEHYMAFLFCFSLSSIVFLFLSKVVFAVRFENDIVYFRTMLGMICPDISSAKVYSITNLSSHIASRFIEGADGRLYIVRISRCKLYFLGVWINGCSEAVERAFTEVKYSGWGV